VSGVHTAAFGGKRTPKHTIISALEDAEDAQLAIVVLLDKDGYVMSAWSDGSCLKRLGLLEIAKQRMVDTLREDGD